MLFRSFPSLYADALYALDDELDRIFEVADYQETVQSGDGSVTRLKALTIGTSVVFQGYDVKVRIDEYFGGHVAILGNTGSGKSCTVATVLQSLFEKPDELIARGATFILLDVNGEYRKAFSKLPDGIQRLYLRIALDPEAAEPEPLDTGETTGIFRLPHWFMSVEEWELLLRASERTQQPVLRSALGLTELLADGSDGTQRVRKHIVAKCVIECFRGVEGDSPVSKIHRVLSILDRFKSPELNRDILTRHRCNVRYGNFDNATDQTAFLDELKTHVKDDIVLPSYTGKPFEFSALEECLDLAILYEEAHGNRQIRDYCSQMLTRFKWIREREEFAFLRVPVDQLRDEVNQIGRAHV